MPSPRSDEHSIAQAAARLAAAGETMEVLALTRDASLLRTLRESVSAQQRIWHATTPDEAVELIMRGRVGVIVIDTLAAPDDAGEFCDRVRAQFPDLVLIAAGGTEEQTQLVKQITSGDIYRFLHKPVSPARARQFVEAAMRRHLEGRTFTPAETAAAPTFTRNRLYIAIALGGVILAAIAVAVSLLFPPGPAPVEPPAAAASSSVDAPASAEVAAPEGRDQTASPALPSGSPPPSEAAATLARAHELLAAGALVAPASPNAAELFGAVLALEPGNTEAQAGLDQIADRLLTNAETALLEERTDHAARDIEAARSVRPNNVRLAFLSAQLDKERERRLIAQAREAAESGNHQRARALLDRAAREQGSPSPVLAEVRKELERRRLADNVGGLLQLANERLEQDRLVEPAGDSARSYIEAALAADSRNLEARQARRVLADRLLANARKALARQEVAAAERLLGHAQSLGADAGQTRLAQRELQRLRQTALRSAEVERVARLMQERIAADRIVEPEGDSARHYWQELRAVDADHASLQPALVAIGAQLVLLGRESFARADLETTQRMLDAAREMGYGGNALAALERDVAAGRERAAFLLNVVPVNELESVRMSPPRYPTIAERQQVEGSVSLEFTVTLDGSVKDVNVTEATPSRTFEDAAIRAVSQWKFRPVMRDGQPVEQRAHVVVRFDLVDR